MTSAKAMAPALALAAALAACSDEAPPPPAQMFLPAGDNLPYRFNQDCGCMRDGECAMVEEQPGFGEIRKLDCRWLRPNAVAECRYEERFTAHHHVVDGNVIEVIESPGPWKPNRLRAILLRDGRWCAG